MEHCISQWKWLINLFIIKASSKTFRLKRYCSFTKTIVLFTEGLNALEVRRWELFNARPRIAIIHFIGISVDCLTPITNVRLLNVTCVLSKAHAWYENITFFSYYYLGVFRKYCTSRNGGLLFNFIIFSCVSLLVKLKWLWNILFHWT